MITKKINYGRLFNVLAVFVAIIQSAYYYYLAAPSAVKVRPKLKTVDFWTAFWTGHGIDWLFYHEPLLGVVAIFVIWLGIVNVVVAWRQ